MADQPHKILVVDDVTDWRATLCGILQDAGYEVVVAGSKEETRQRLEEHEIDLALIDLSLDPSDETNREGLDIAQEMQRSWPHVKSILITGYGTPEIAHMVLRPDQDGRSLVESYLSKDESDQLIRVVNKLLGVAQEH
jgi:CheY-like chemotaxis protein